MTICRLRVDGVMHRLADEFGAWPAEQTLCLRVHVDAISLDILHIQTLTQCLADVFVERSLFVPAVSSIALRAVMSVRMET